MPYLGNTPTTQSFISGTDYFNGTGAQTAFTLSRTVASVNDIQAVVNNVVQVPNDAYTISGTTITFTSAPSSGTQNVYVRYLSTTTQAITPSQNTVSWNTLDSNVQGDLGISFKNRIINGAMQIDQRNAGASVTPTNGQYTLDRWYTGVAQTSKLTIQQDAGAVTPPVGFTDYLGITSTSAYSVTSTDFFYVQQTIEGFNIADLAWGTANAKTVTLSFWVRSSLTGTFSGTLRNYVGNRSYPYTYTINSANTWEYKTVTIPGDTTGTWTTTNSGGVDVGFSVGAGSSRSGTAGAWAGSAFYAATGAVSVVGTNGATFYITGVQLEVGTQATTFTTAGGSYGAELALCQRYAIRYAGEQVYELIGIIFTESSTSTILIMPLPVFMRTTPSVSFSTLRIVENLGAAVAVTAVNTKGSEGGNKVAFLNPTAASGLTASRSGWLSANNSTSAFLLLSAEL